MNYSPGVNRTVLCCDVTAEQMKVWARMLEIEFVHITKDTAVDGLEQQLFLYKSLLADLMAGSMKG